MIGKEENESDEDEEDEDDIGADDADQDWYKRHFLFVHNKLDPFIFRFLIYFINFHKLVLPTLNVEKKSVWILNNQKYRI